MTITTRRAGAIVAAALIVTVITQIVYFTVLAETGIVEGWPLRSALWTIEVLAFALMAVAALAAMARDADRSLIWSALAVSAFINVIQAGIGLSMFLPAMQAGEAFAPLMGTLVAGAFLFYFLAKLLIGLAAMGFGLILFRDARASVKAFGALTVVAGLAAAAANLAALPQGTALILAGGATGTLAALVTGIAAFVITRGEED
ncbi:MAG: hypothetical protein HKN78_08480 [Sphingomonadaceae bacterium]|nr:hypothetical protein [Sphingomonadaceae bacterium]